MTTVQDEHAYLLKRSADHRALAGGAAVAASRAAHENFAAAYAERAAALIDGDDAPIV